MGFMQAPSGGGDFTTYVKFNAKAGRFYTKKDEKDAPEFEVTNMTAIFDMDNIKTGWFLFVPGVAPVKQFDPSLTEESARPAGEGKWKRGFELLLFSEKNLLGVREFCSTAGVVIEAMNDLYDHWQAGKAANAGKLPVVKSVGVQPITGTHGTNYKPQFEIVSWSDRPAELDGKVAAKAEPKQEAKREPEPVGGAGDDDVEY